MDNKVIYTVTANDILSGKLREMDKNARGLEGTMGSLASKIGMAFGAYQVAGFVRSVISAGTTVEDAMTGLTTLLGNSAEANRVVQNTMADASATPFAFEGLLSANKALIGAGVSADGARTDVLNLANAIASTGGGDDELQRMVVNMQQIRNVGKASALDIKQFAFAGVNVYKALADATGKPIESIKGMEISYDMLTMALQKAHDKGGIYYNGLENMSKNTSVRISAIGDAVFQTMNDLFQDFKPMIDGVLESTMSLIDGVKELLGWFREHRAVTTALGEAIKVTAGAILLFVTYQKSMAIWTALTTTSIFAQTFSAGMFMDFGASSWNGTG
jgi:tape measure domain-containing protein